MARAPGLGQVAAMLFVSGGCALLFQMAWMRELRLVFGSTTASVAAVLAVFMAGLGIGSAVLGRRADVTANPLRMYGLLEGAVAVSVAVSPLVLWLVAALYFRLGGQEALGLTGATLARLMLAAAVMGLPTFLMGGTLPAAVRSITTAADTRRRGLAVLYGVNTLGAVCGAYLATFFFMEFLGTRATLWFGCALNLLVAMAAISRARWVPEVAATDTAGVKDASAVDDPPAAGASWLVYATAAVLGFTFFTLELVWYRMLGPILGGTTFTFGLILCFALLGIGIGGACYHLVFRWVRPSWSVLALTCAAEAALAALPLALGDWLALVAGQWFLHSTTFTQVQLGWCLVMSIVVLPVALVSGLQFPLVVAMLGQGRVAVSRQLGMTYAWNTLGAIAGSLVGGFGALPLLTAPGAWRAVALLLAVLSAILIARSWRGAVRTTAAVALLLLLTVFFVTREGPTAVWRHSGIGAGRANLPPAEEVNAVLMWCNEQRRNLKWEAEGIESSIGITAPDGLSFIVNGKNDGNAVGDAGTQIGVAILGSLLHPDPRKGLVIGLGTGESAGWLASLGNMERVDVVELEPAIDEMARRSSALNRNVLENPKIRRIYNDGREHVLTTDEKYDVVLSEPSNPYRAGVASLYTQEFYRAVRDRLTPKGVFVQWVQAYEVDDFTIKTVLATARSVFDYVEIWQTIPGDLQVICSQQPIEYAEAALRTRIEDPVMKEALRTAWRVHDLEGLLARYVGNRDFVDRSLQGDSDHELNTDDQNFLEYGFAKTVGLSLNFSSGELRQAAMDLGMHRPPLAASNSVDWDLVEQRRVEFNAVFNGDMTPFEQTSPTDRLRIKAYTLTANGYFREALDAWAELPPEPASDVERLFRARAHAELNEEKCLELIAPIAGQYPAETALIRAIYHLDQDQAKTAEAVADALQALAHDPWAINSMIRPLVNLGPVVAEGDDAAAKQIFDLLARPLAASRMEHHRLILRLFVAEGLGREYVLEALADLEPNPPWMGPLLEMRADTYKAADHPLAEKAQQDVELYRRHAK